MTADHLLHRRRRWLGAFLLVTGLGAAWAFATPVFAAPDEPAHVVRAVSAARGQLLGREFGPGEGPPYPVPVDRKPWLSGLAVDVPAVYRHWGNINCVVFNLYPPATADCLRFDGPDRDAPALTYVGRYPPEYYLVVGVGAALVPAGRAQVYTMRIITVLLCAALVASAFVTLTALAPGAAGLLGLAIAITPMALFLFGSVSSSALEIAAGIGVWAHGLALALRGPDVDEHRVVARFGIAATVLVLMRPGSLAWLALAVAVLALLAGRTRLAELLRDARCRVWTGIVAVAVIAQLAWFAYADTLDLRRSFIAVPVDATTGEALRASFASQFDWLREMVGNFGWLDTPIPDAALVIWVLAIVAVTGFALVVAPRFRVPLVAILALCVIVPVAYQVQLFDTVGYFWQGRYMLPFAVGVPIMAGVAIGESTSRVRVTVRVVVVVGVALALAQVLGFAQALRRYSVGIEGPIWFFGDARWDPPIPSVVLVLAFAALVGAGVLALSRAVASPAR